MRKITLFIASLFLTIGAMAQTLVLELTADQIGTTYPKQLSDADAAKVFALTDLTVAVRINTRDVGGRMSLFATSDPTQAANTAAEGKNSRYVGYGMNNADVGYLASWISGDRFTGKTNSGIVANANDMIVVYVINPSNRTFKAYVNGVQEKSWYRAHNDGFMQGYEIATPKMVKEDHTNACIYIGGAKNSSGNGEVFNGTITGVKVYDGVLTADQILALSTTVDENEVTSYDKLESGKIYTFKSQRGWLMATSGTDFVYNSAKLGTAANASKENANCQWVLYSTDKGKYLYNVGVGKFISVNKSDANSIPLSATPTTAAVEFKASTLNAYPIIVGIEGYAVNHNTSNDAFTYGALLWKDGWAHDTWLNDAGSCHKVTYVADANTETLNTVKELVYSYEMQGSYFRLKGNSGNYVDASSIYNNATAKYGQMSMKSKDACNLAGTIFYWCEDNKFLNYTTGTYVCVGREIAAINADNGKNTAWRVYSSAAEGKYKLYGTYQDNGTKNVWLHDNSGNRADRCSNEADHANTTHSWTIEKVESLPVTITSAGYATFYAPVAVEVPENVKAYTITVDGDRAVFSENSLGVIPANTGVVLKAAAGTYNFAITTTTATVVSDLRGSAAATYYTEAGTYYALGVVGGVVAFYKDEFNNNRFQNNSHKAYLYVASPQNSASLRFDFGTTAIEEVEVENAEAEVIYDLCGRRVNEITKAGVYIVNGKKTLVK